MQNGKRILVFLVVLVAGLACARRPHWIPRDDRFNARQLDAAIQTCVTESNPYIWVPALGMLIRASVYKRCMQARGFRPGRPTAEQIVFDRSRVESRYEEDVQTCSWQTLAKPLTSEWNEEMRECMEARGHIISDQP